MQIEYKRFFEKFGDDVLNDDSFAGPFRDRMNTEALYQAFKARMLDEIYKKTENEPFEIDEMD
jgi:hypothetical protein